MPGDAKYGEILVYGKVRGDCPLAGWVWAPGCILSLSANGCGCGCACPAYCLPVGVGVSPDCPVVGVVRRYVPVAVAGE